MKQQVSYIGAIGDTVLPDTYEDQFTRHVAEFAAEVAAGRVEICSLAYVLKDSKQSIGVFRGSVHNLLCLLDQCVNQVYKTITLDSSVGEDKEDMQ